MTDSVPKPAPGCAGPADPASIPVDSALARIQSLIEPVGGVEKMSVRSALGRVIAMDVLSPVDVPAHTNSAMDGFALNARDLPDGDSAELAVVGTAYAGQPFQGSVVPGTCVRIMTGAKMPPGADTVVMQEEAEPAGERVRIFPGHRSGQNVRLAGEDLAAGGVALRAGQLVGPAELGLIASLGIAEVHVRRRVRVAFFSTGDELKSIGEALADGEIYDSNRYTLFGMLTRLGVEIIDMGIIRDTRDGIGSAFEAAAAMADVVITTGGVSVGEADYVKETLDRIGRVQFWKIAMKPGRPLAFGTVDNAMFFGLPGNPVAVMVTFYQFVQPALKRLMGLPFRVPERFLVPCSERLKKSPGRTEFQRAVLEPTPDGRWEVRTTGRQGSGILRSMSEANCFIVLPHDGATVEAGTPVPVQPFWGLI